ncbi:MAG: hypothetical protein ACQERB_13770 [Promethearchaeati archaeon]
MNTLEFLNGFLSLIYVGISLLIGLTLIYSYFKRNEKILIYIGFSLIGIVTPWYPSSISFIVALFNYGKGIPEVLYYIIGNAFGPLFLFVWLVVFTNYYYQKYKKYILGASIIYGIVFEIIFFTLLILDPSNIAYYEPPVNVEFTGIYLILAVSVIMIFFITGILFSYGAITCHRQEDKIKGFFVFTAFISYTLGAFLDAAVQQDYLNLIITRTILISGAIEWYFGFIMPNWLKKRILN